MSERISDFRSDTVTKPTPEMRKAMYEAEVGDDVFGDDPTVKKLEKMAAELMGKEAALFVASGTMGNAIAVKAWTKEGDEVIVEERSHIYNFESGHMAFISRVQVRPLPSKRGVFDLRQLEAALAKKEDIHFAPPTLITIENTHNFWGGAVIPLTHFKAVRELADRYGQKIHLDGARIFNAAFAAGVEAKEFARYADSVMFCISKGLGAPIGSLLAGPSDFIRKARKIRKMLGGGMRQVGVIAAPGIVALEKMIERIPEDHRLAKKLARGLESIEHIEVNSEEVETNIVFFDVTHPEIDALKLAERMREKGVLAIAVGRRRMRMVTHKDVDDSDVDRALEAISEILKG